MVHRTQPPRHPEGFSTSNYLPLPWLPLESSRVLLRTWSLGPPTPPEIMCLGWARALGVCKSPQVILIRSPKLEAPFCTWGFPLWFAGFAFPFGRASERPVSKARLHWKLTEWLARLGSVLSQKRAASPPVGLFNYNNERALLQYQRRTFYHLFSSSWKFLACILTFYNGALKYYLSWSLSLGRVTLNFVPQVRALLTLPF